MFVKKFTTAIIFTFMTLCLPSLRGTVNRQCPRVWVLCLDASNSVFCRNDIGGGGRGRIDGW